MPRTTLNLDGPVLDELRRRGERDRKPLGRVASDLLARALAERGPRLRAAPRLAWSDSPGQLRVDPLDKEAIYAALDAEAVEGEATPRRRRRSP